ncbi:MAG: ribosome biogenesis factor YjgA [Pseudomonadota bacterium]
MQDEFDDVGEQESHGRRSHAKMKRESAVLLELGRELVLLPQETLNRLTLPEQVAEAVRLGRTISAHGALKRQIKYIGKLLRQIDSGPIRSALDDIKSDSVEAARRQHRIERWRDRLIAEGDEGVNALAGEFPGADRQLLRKLVRGAREEREQAKPPRHARQLFQEIRRLLADAAEPPE